MLSKKIAFLMAIVFVIPFAILVPWVRNKIATSHLKLKNDKAVVQFYPDYLMINDKKIDLFLNNRWIRNMKISDGKNGLKLLEIEIAWETRKGDTFDETRIPIPADNIENAREIIEFYRKYKS